MITEHTLIKGTPEEIQQYIVSQIGYKHHDIFDITDQLNKIGLEKQGRIVYFQQVSDIEIELNSIYVHIIDSVLKENARQKILDNLNRLATKLDDKSS